MPEITLDNTLQTTLDNMLEITLDTSPKRGCTIQVRNEAGYQRLHAGCEADTRCDTRLHARKDTRHDMGSTPGI
jgi:hypothetical protein